MNTKTDFPGKIDIAYIKATGIDQAVNGALAHHQRVPVGHTYMVR